MLERIRAELESALSDRRIAKIIPFSRNQLVIDFRDTDGKFLYISLEPGDPRTYLIRRRSKEVEKASANPSVFIQSLRKLLPGGIVERVSKLPNERVISIGIRTASEVGDAISYSLIIQLTGRSANLLILDATDRVLDSLRDTSGVGQERGTIYSPPARSGPAAPVSSADEDSSSDSGRSLSEVLDERYSKKEREEQFRSRAGSAHKKIGREISKRQKLVRNLEADLKNHGDADKWKRYGDLLLANLATARRETGKFIVTDFYDEALPEITIDAEHEDSITETSEKYFRRYARARNAAGEIANRLETLNNELTGLKIKNERLNRAISEKDESFFGPENVRAAATRPRRSKTSVPKFRGAREYTSSEGYQILVGKKAKDNDELTFRIARSLDLWFHAADYPGSHVVVRNQNRSEITPKCLVEAAQLAAFYSDARQQPKAAVNYTEKKFVNKPRGAAPGLVRLASFKTILVEPKIPDSVSFKRPADDH